MSRLTRHDILKEDKFLLTMEGARDFLLAHKKPILMLGCIMLAVLLVGVGGYYYVTYSSQAAKNELGQALETFQAPVGQPAETAGAILSFTTPQEKYQKALAEFQKVPQHTFSFGDGKIAEYYMGLCLMSLQRENEAVGHLEPLSREKSDLGALALVALAGIYESQGNLAKAIEMRQQVISADVAAAPKSQNLLQLAELYEQQNNPSEAIKTYQQLIKEYPDSPLVQKANQQIKQISR